MKPIDILAKHNTEWLDYVIKHALKRSHKNFPEDVVQEAYLKFLSNSKKSELVFKETYMLEAYFFKMLRNIMISQYKKKEIKQVPIDEKTIQSKVNEIEVVEYTELIKKINCVVDQFYWYDKKMFNLYRYRIPSIRKISMETQISKKSVFKTLKNCKNKIKKELAVEYYKIAI